MRYMIDSATRSRRLALRWISPRPGPQVLRVLHVERQLRAEQEDQPRDVQPDQRHDHDGEAGVDDDVAWSSSTTNEAKIMPLQPTPTPANSAADQRGAQLHAWCSA